MLTGNDDLLEAPRIHASVNDVARQVANGEVQMLDPKDIRCEWCGGYHATNCWAVIEAEFYPDGKWSKIKLLPRPMLEKATLYDLDEDEATD